MTNEQFVEELKQEIDRYYTEITTRARESYECTNRNKFFGRNKRFTMPDDYLSYGNMSNIRGLHSFAHKHKELRGTQIEALIRQNASTFKFLNKFIDCMDDIVDEMRVHGYMYGAMVYRNSMARIYDINKSLKYTK